MTKTQMAYRMIRSKIMSGAFKPGEHLNISELAVQAGMSIIPVREAINQLQIEGLIELDAYRGIRVVSYTEAELREVYLIRAELEGLAGRLAAENSSEADIIKLQKILDDPKKSATKINTEFHKYIYLKANSERLYTMIMNLWDTWYLVSKGLALQHVEGQKERSKQEHSEILEAIKNHDGILTDELIHKHILEAGDSVTEWIKSKGTCTKKK